MEAGPSISTGSASGRSTATGISLSLDKEVERVEVSVADQIKLGDHGLRRWMVISFVFAVIFGDVVTLGCLGWLSSLDQTNLQQKLILPGERIINNQVIMTLLGATTVQVGTIAAIIARYLFTIR